MDTVNSGAALLHSPRGRRLCLEGAVLAQPELRRHRPGFSPDPLSAAAVDAFAAALHSVDATGIAGVDLLGALAETVDRAQYWQPLDVDDEVLAQESVRTALVPLAAAIANTPSASWWQTPVDTVRQQHVQWLDYPATDVMDLSGAAAKLARWKASAGRAEERARSRPAAVSAPFGGEWWSTPALAGIPSTTRGLPGQGAAALALTEDSCGWKQALLSPVAPLHGARIYEISGPQEWADLAARYPTNVSLTRRHDWWRITGEDTAWLIPDWQAVAADFDGVHLSVWGYLSTAGAALDAGVGAAKTVLAGWGPDATFWLTDVLQPAGTPQDWALHIGNPDQWVPSGPAR